MLFFELVVVICLCKVVTSLATVHMAPEPMKLIHPDNPQPSISTIIPVGEVSRSSWSRTPCHSRTPPRRCSHSLSDMWWRLAQLFLGLGRCRYLSIAISSWWFVCLLLWLSIKDWFETKTTHKTTQRLFTIVAGAPTHVLYEKPNITRARTTKTKNKKTSLTLLTNKQIDLSFGQAFNTSLCIAKIGERQINKQRIELALYFRIFHQVAERLPVDRELALGTRLGVQSRAFDDWRLLLHLLLQIRVPTVETERVTARLRSHFRVLGLVETQHTLLRRSHHCVRFVDFAFVTRVQYHIGHTYMHSLLSPIRSEARGRASLRRVRNPPWTHSMPTFPPSDTLAAILGENRHSNDRPMRERMKNEQR